MSAVELLQIYLNAGGFKVQVSATTRFYTAATQEFQCLDALSVDRLAHYINLEYPMDELSSLAIDHSRYAVRASEATVVVGFTPGRADLVFQVYEIHRVKVNQDLLVISGHEDVVAVDLSQPNSPRSVWVNTH